MPSQRTFTAGLVAQTPIDASPEGTLRRGRGLSRNSTGAATSRNGITSLFAATAHSLVRFNGVRFYAAATSLYRNGFSIQAVSGQRMSFVIAPPTPGKPDYLFMADGTSMLKVDTAGAVTNWSIAQPATAGFTAAKGSGSRKTIDTFQDFVAPNDWLAMAGTCTVAADATNAVTDDDGTDPTHSLEMILAAEDTLGRAYRNLPATLDLTTYGAVASPAEDYISLWVRVEDPDSIEYLYISFATGGTFDASASSQNTYTRIVLFAQAPQDQEPVGSARGKNQDSQRSRVVSSNSYRYGIGDSIITNQGAKQQQQSDYLDNDRRSLIADSLTVAVPTPNAWFELKLPKDAFVRLGDGATTWSDIRGMVVGAKTKLSAVVPTSVWFDYASLRGGYGLRGRYRYFYTAKNSTTGSESNPNDAYVEVTEVDREPIDLTFPGTHTDAQVDKWVLYRTFGDGGLYFKVTEQPITITSYQDTTADYPGMHSGSTTYLQIDELAYDNVAAPATTGDIVGLHYGRIWTLRDSAAGRGTRLYYTRPGYVEGFQGYVDVSSDDDQLQKGVIFNRQLYVFSRKGCYVISNTTQPFIASLVRGVPGTTHPHSVQVTPFGVVYEADDGIRVFDGASSSVAPSAPILDIFHGRALEGLDAWAGTIASTAGEDLYYVTDGSQTLCLDAQGRWRDLGLAATALDFEPDTGLFTCSYTGVVGVLEAEGVVQDAGQPITIQWQLPMLRVSDADQQAVLRRISIEMDPGGNIVTPTLLIDNTETVLAPLTGTSRQFIEYARCDPGLRFALRLDSDTTDTLTLYGVEWTA